MQGGKRSSNLTDKISATDKEVGKFGLMFGGIASALCGYMLYRGSGHWPWAAGSAAFFFLTGLFLRPALRPVYIGWMKFAFVLGWVNTRLLLGIFFYLVLTPIGLFLRITGKDLLDRRIDRSAKSYWIKRGSDPVDKSRYERLF